MNDEEECAEEGVPAFAWRFSAWDVLGIVSHVGANAAVAVANGFGLLSREFAAAANRSRQNYDNRQAAREASLARREMARDLRGLISFEEVDPS